MSYLGELKTHEKNRNNQKRGKRSFSLSSRTHNRICVLDSNVSQQPGLYGIRTHSLIFSRGTEAEYTNHWGRKHF